LTALRRWQFGQGVNKSDKETEERRDKEGSGNESKYLEGRVWGEEVK
jgi:hypothetical protein